MRQGTTENINWYLVKKNPPEALDKISATVSVPGDSPWFAGHFPGNPVLPAIAQVSIVFDMICRWNNKPIFLKAIHRVKFKRVILPDEEMEIYVSQVDGKPMNYSFQISVKGDVACKGTLQTDISRN